MFGFRKKKPAPPTCKSNPGIGIEAKVAFSNGERSWTEKINLVDLTATVFKKRGYSITNERTWLHDKNSGYMIQPQLVGLEPLQDGGARTVTTIQCNHPTLCPNGVFEYQHSAGDTVADSIAKGFDQWIQTDYVALLDALHPKPETCTMMEMSFPASDGKPARVRRAILGPVAHFMADAKCASGNDDPEEHPFCPCCLLTNSFEAFRDLLEGDEFYGIRLFAARTTEGTPEADCRVNGDDFDEGMDALRKCATSWPVAGYEFRKQYVVLQSI